jgi:CheY-like chemotaxis protein
MHATLSAVMKVLVCDDDPVIRYLLEVVLGKRGGHEVIATGVSTEVADLVRSHRPDVVLLDFVMPGLTGLDVANEMSADPMTSSTPIVFLTGRADIEDDEIDGLNVLGVIEKPFETATLGDRLAELIKQ